MTTFRVNRRGTPEAGATFPKLNYAIQHLNYLQFYEKLEGDVEVIPHKFFICSTYQGHITSLRVWECATRPLFLNKEMHKTPS
jgi:hypothetical protein